MTYKIISLYYIILHENVRNTKNQKKDINKNEDVNVKTIVKINNISK
jgi:hypothetical protein